MERCLVSVINNTYKNLEIICVIDGATDNSYEIAYRYSQLDSRIIIICQENQGQSSARNIGLDVSRGEYIAFVDSDDYIDSRYFEILIKPFFENKDLDISIAKHIKVNKCDYLEKYDGAVNYIVTNSLQEAINCFETRNVVWSKIYKKTYIGSERFAVGYKFEDKLFNNILYSKRDHHKFSFSDAKIYYYQVNIESTMCTTSYVKMLDTVDVYLLQLQSDEIINKHYLYEEMFKTFVVSRYLCKSKTKEEKEKFDNKRRICLEQLNKCRFMDYKHRIYWWLLLRFSCIYYIGKLKK